MDLADVAAHTTLGLGGPARRLVTATDEQALVAAVTAADATGEPLLVLGGGSNVVVADEGFAGTVVLVRTSGISMNGESVEAAAGEEWDAFVRRCVGAGRAGVECLAGIPGSVGATPVQNVGAYGQDVAQTIVAVRALDRRSGTVTELTHADCGFGYRSSAFKAEPGRWVVLAVRFRLPVAETSAPISYAELARALGVDLGATVPLATVGPAVRALRAGKGMVLDPGDADTSSVGSFFTNPIVSADAFAALGARAAELGLGEPPHWPEPGGGVKLSAAWLVQRAGFGPGYGTGPVRVSTKHALALTHRGGGTAQQLVALAREIRDGVLAAFDVVLVPEPVLVGLTL